MWPNLSEQSHRGECGVIAELFKFWGVLGGVMKAHQYNFSNGIHMTLTWLWPLMQTTFTLYHVYCIIMHYASQNSRVSYAYRKHVFKNTAYVKCHQNQIRIQIKINSKPKQLALTSMRLQLYIQNFFFIHRSNYLQLICLQTNGYIWNRNWEKLFKLSTYKFVNVLVKTKNNITKWQIWNRTYKISIYYSKTGMKTLQNDF